MQEMLPTSYKKNNHFWLWYNLVEEEYVESAKNNANGQKGE